MAGTSMQSKIFSTVFPCFNLVANNTIKRHICSFHSTTQSKVPLFHVPSQLTLLNAGNTLHSDHHTRRLRQHVTPCSLRPFHHQHTCSSKTHLPITISGSNPLFSNSVPQNSSPCSFKSFHQSCPRQNDWETQTSPSAWVRTSTKSLHQQTKDIVFAEKILETVCPPSGSVVLDMTFGSGTHTEGILKKNPGVKVIAIDRDPVTKARAEELRALYPNRLCFLNIKFSEVPNALYSLRVPRSSLWGAVLDAGPSYEQLTQPKRGGFCPTATEKLDLRMDGASSKTISALDVVQTLDLESLRIILRYYGQNKRAYQVADAIVQARYEMIDLRTPADLVNFVSGLVGDASDGSSENQQDGDVKPPPTRNFASSPNAIPIAAGRVFQALRILINNELDELDCAMRVVHHHLRPNAPFAIITYNALEHAIVKRHFTGRNVDASVDKIGRPRHRLGKVLGEEKRGDDCRPWNPLDVMVTRWGQPIKHPQWKNGELRLARKNAGTVYDLQDQAEDR